MSGASKPHIFLTGERQVGKSFLINRVLSAVVPEFNIRRGGFITLGTAPRADGTSEVLLYRGDGSMPCGMGGNIAAHRGVKSGSAAADMLCGSSSAPCMIPHPEVFETLGVSLLSDCGDLVMMDELGFIERDAVNFKKKIFEILDTDMPVLGVIKKKEGNEFLDAVKNHPKSAVYEITPENRKEMYSAVLEAVRDVLKK